MSDDDKYYRTAEFKKLQREWYGKLADTGFVDIEDGLEDATVLGGEGHVMSVALSGAHFGKVGGVDNVHDMLDSEHPMVNYQAGHKASYYRAATVVASFEALNGCPKKYFIYAYLCQGIGDRTIVREAEELNGWHFTRYYVRQVANEFREKVLSVLDDNL